MGGQNSVAQEFGTQGEKQNDWVTVISIATVTASLGLHFGSLGGNTRKPGD
jgi:hypothetical protein